MNDKPAIFLYTGDLWKDISFRLCGWQAQNLWLRLLMLLHDNIPRGKFCSESGVPYTDEQLAALCNMPIADFRVLREELESNNVFSRIAGAIANRRMVREAELHENKVKGGKLGAKSRWQKHNRTLADGNGKPIVTSPTYSSSSSSSSSNKEEKSSAGAPPSDDEWLEGLKKNPAYTHIDFTVELGKMDAWLLLPKNKHRKKTRAFILNWLNKIDKPVHMEQKPKRPILYT